MNTDLREIFESGLGSEPPLVPAQVRVVAGRRALRRRRVVSGSVVAGAVLVVALGATQVGPSSPSSTPMPSNQVTADTRTDVEAQLTAEAPVDDAWLERCGRGGQPPCAAYKNGAAPVALRADGTLTRITPDVVIIKRAEDRVLSDGTREVEVELRTAAYPQPCWYVLTRSPSGKVTAKTADPARSSIDFASWVAGLRAGVDVHGSPPLSRDRVLVDD